jgi:hypothetical protein
MATAADMDLPNAVDTNSNSATVRTPIGGGADVMPKDGCLPEQVLEKIPTPAPVERLLADCGPLVPAERHRLEKQLKLSYLFGGFDVACVDTEAGTFIVASGPGREVAAKLDDLSDAEFETIYIERPPTWSSLVSSQRHIAARAR